MKQFIQYGVKPVDNKSVFNRFCYAYIQWFDGEDIVIQESGDFDNEEDDYKWIADMFKCPKFSF